MPCAIVGVHCDRSSKMLSRVARLALMSILMLSASTSAMAVEPAAGTLVVVNAWSRATAPGAPVGVAYFDIVNSGGQDALLHIETPVAPQVEMHSTATVGGLMQMRRVLSVEVPAHGRVRFEPNGLHAMLIDLVRPLKKGDRFPLTLMFQHAGPVRVEAIVQDLGTMTAPGGKDPDK
jgi:copper(I)-binding protein